MNVRGVAKDAVALSAPPFKLTWFVSRSKHGIGVDRDRSRTCVQNRRKRAAGAGQNQRSRAALGQARYAGVVKRVVHRQRPRAIDHHEAFARLEIDGQRVGTGCGSNCRAARAHKDSTGRHVDRVRSRARERIQVAVGIRAGAHVARGRGGVELNLRDRIDVADCGGGNGNGIVDDDRRSRGREIVRARAVDPRRCRAPVAAARHGRKDRCARQRNDAFRRQTVRRTAGIVGNRAAVDRYRAEGRRGRR